MDTLLTSPQPRTERATSNGTWIGLLLLGLAEAVVVFVVGGLAFWSQQTICNQSPTADEVFVARRTMAIVTGIAAAPWAVAAVLARRHWLAIAAAGLVGALPAIVLFLIGLDESAWVGSFC